MLQEKKVILGISGGIAAYKAAFLIRLFRKAEAEVKVVGTRNAFEFITKVTLESLSENKVYDEVFGPENDYTTEHISLTDWGDVFVVAPATANIIGKLANGIADDALSTSLLAFNKKIFVAPAMNCKMYDHFATQKNLQTLKYNNLEIIEPAEGYLACGYEGKGRMEEAEVIFDKVRAYFLQSQSLSGKTILVTAGPTHEAIDPVRYIGNHSSGKMGYAIAEELSRRGARVHLISGPVDIGLNDPAINLIKITSAGQMLDVCQKVFPEVDAAIMAAAVADFTPANRHTAKVKKSDNPKGMALELVPAPDILEALGKMKKKNQVLAGFALETDKEEENAKAKLKKKNLDFIVLNSLQDTGAGFGTNTNKISILNNNGEIIRFNLKSKKAAASDVADNLTAFVEKKS